MDSSPLARLPAELRTAIYEYLYCSDQYTVLQVSGSVTALRQLPTSRPLCLPAACRQLRAEALPIFWTNSKFMLVGRSFLSSRVARPVEEDVEDDSNAYNPSYALSSWHESINLDHFVLIPEMQFNFGTWYLTRDTEGFERRFFKQNAQTISHLIRSLKAKGSQTRYKANLAIVDEVMYDVTLPICQASEARKVLAETLWQPVSRNGESAAKCQRAFEEFVEWISP